MDDREGHYPTIDTAPVDEIILVYAPGCGWVVAEMFYGEWVSVCQTTCGRCWDANAHRSLKPTHWTLCPNPPETAQERTDP